MDVESVKSGRSDRSRHSQSASSRNAVRRPHSSTIGHHHLHHGSRAAVRMAGEPLLRHGMESDTDRDDRSSRISRRNRHLPEAGQDRMQMRAYDDQFDNVTVITGATSEFAYSLEDLSKTSTSGSGKNLFRGRSLCSKFVAFCGKCLVLALCIASFLSPIVMVVLPKIPAVDWDVDSCDPECESALLGIGFKLLILLVAVWALFFRTSRANLPRLDPGKASVVFVIFLVTFSFWLFYSVRFFQKLTVTYLGVVTFASSLVDSLLFVHYLAVVLFELRRLQNRFAVKIVRSPDGASRTYSVGQMTVQNLAVWCLDKYYTDFQSYNPYLEILPKKNGSNSGTPAFKLYDVDGVRGPENGDKEDGRGGSNGGGRNFPVVPPLGVGGRAGHNERFYGEQEYERRVSRRKSRLQASAEEAFMHLKKVKVDSGSPGGHVLTAQEAAQAIFPTVARPLQKYLRVTRQQPKYTMDNVLKHLSKCISYEMSSKAFLERYLQQGEVIWTEVGWSKLKLTSFKGEVGVTSDTSACNSGGKRKKRESHSWALTCQGFLNRSIDEKCILQLTRSVAGGESLVVTFRRLPFFDVVEQPADVRDERFVLNLNAELSV